MAKTKSLNELDAQWSRLRDDINRCYGRYDREFGCYNTPKSGIGAAQNRRALRAYLNTRCIIQSNLEKQGAATQEGMLVGVNYNRIMRVPSK